MDRKIPVWIDTDTGVDDALALLYAVNLKELDVAGVSAAAGNQTIDKTFRNARNVLSLLGREDIKVYKGAEKPLAKELHTAAYCHGENGLGEYEIPDSKAPVEEGDAIEAIYECAKKYAGELVLVPVGPLTNIALLLQRHPDVRDLVREVAVMGGSLSGGNITPYAEFNIFVDPLAAKIVFESGMRIIMCGLDVTLKAYLLKEEIEAFGRIGNPVGDLIEGSTGIMLELGERRGKPGMCLHDSTPLFYEAHPEYFQGKETAISVVTEGEKEGMTFETEGEKNTLVLLDIERDPFVDALKEYVRRY